VKLRTIYRIGMAGTAAVLALLLVLVFRIFTQARRVASEERRAASPEDRPGARAGRPRRLAPLMGRRRGAGG
jgi:hypothetical protein